jgi:hypothetical protein
MLAGYDKEEMEYSNPGILVWSPWGAVKRKAQRLKVAFCR